MGFSLKYASNCGLALYCAAACRRSPSNRRIAPCSAPQSLTAFSTSVSKTGWRSNAERLMTLRTSLVAVCCSCASVSERCKSSYGSAGWALPSGRRRGVPHSSQNFAAARFSCSHRGHVMPEPPAAGSAKGRNRWPRLTGWDLHGQEDGHRGHLLGLAGCRRSWLPHRASAVAGSLSGRCPYCPPWSKGRDSFPAFRSFPLCYTAGRHEAARREPKVELMTEPADRAVLLLQRVGKLLLESRAIAQQLEVVPEAESSADAANPIAYGVLVAGLEEGLVNTIRHALDLLKRFSAPAGLLGQRWLDEQKKTLEDSEPR